MKKIIVSTLLSIATTMIANAGCIKPTNENYRQLAATAYTQSYEEQAALMNKYCYIGSLSNQFEMGPVVMVSTVQGLQMLEKAWGGNFVGKSMDEFGNDMFSLKLIQNDPVPLRNESIADAKRTIKSLFPNSKVDRFEFKRVLVEQPDLLNYLATEYSNNFTITKNAYGNYALMYVISTNNGQYLDSALGYTRDKSTYLIKNKSGIAALHAIFANELKGQDTRGLSDKVFAKVPADFYLKANVMTYDYFQFAEAFKDNNPYFYKLLKDRFRFKIKNPISEQDKKYLSKALTLNTYDATD